MFHQSEAAGRWHHSFRLRCDQDHRLAMTDDFEFHIVELPKFRPESDNIGDLPPDQKWLYLFTHAAEMEPEQLSDLLGEEPYREAIGVLEMISKTPEDHEYYEDRLKFLRDEEAKLVDAKQEGREEGREEGLEEGEIKLIRTLQEILGEPVMAQSDLARHNLEQLQSIAEELRSRILGRS